MVETLVRSYRCALSWCDLNLTFDLVVVNFTFKILLHHFCISLNNCQYLGLYLVLKTFIGLLNIYKCLQCLLGISRGVKNISLGCGVRASLMLFYKACFVKECVKITFRKAS